jgi:release factor glutamine methyltransferase
VVVVDLGTGSGAIGLSIASERERVEVWLTDASEDALAVAGANLAGLGRAATRVRIAPAGEWFAALPSELMGSVNLIISNPPYVADGDELPEVVRDWEPASALYSGADGLDDLRVIVSEAPRWLAPGGVLVVELAPMQAQQFAELAHHAGFHEAEIRQDLTGSERAVICRMRS